MSEEELMVDTESQHLLDISEHMSIWAGHGIAVPPVTMSIESFSSLSRFCPYDFLEHPYATMLYLSCDGESRVCDLEGAGPGGTTYAALPENKNTPSLDLALDDMVDLNSSLEGIIEACDALQKEHATGCPVRWTPQIRQLMVNIRRYGQAFQHINTGLESDVKLDIRKVNPLSTSVQQKLLEQLKRCWAMNQPSLKPIYEIITKGTATSHPVLSIGEYLVNSDRSGECRVLHRSSRFGKSRTIYMTFEEVISIPINVRPANEEGQGAYPPRNSSMFDILDKLIHTRSVNISDEGALGALLGS
ncbi:hypothetical protein BDV98DRAFT_584627 [Pterulicium gracile]|uniref:Uncharacterized protein n=1 Tax=Pterulicium gracile TaxID=1884261 RepID=A0A5C3QF21_9AGAR|nr:hypothetical protein BDV98DRAFT_584627 [Pterula gracilis]